MDGRDDVDAVTLVGPGWRRGDGVAVRGHAFDGRQEVSLPDRFAGVDSFSAVLSTADRIEGFYAAVVDLGDTIALVCDHARSVPLYFTTTSPTCVSDIATTLESDPAGFDPTAESEFLLTRYVTRGETLVPTVRSVRAGEAVRLPRDHPAGFDRHRYAHYRPTPIIEGDREALLDRAADILERIFDRTAALVGDRTVAVPLSGGRDSRLVASMLVEQGCDVLGFAFGVPGHADVEVSRDVADALGIGWSWVEYSPDRWHEWYHADDRRAYHEFAFNYDSLPFLAEWPAVRELVEDGTIPENAIVCPGHTVATPGERVPAEWVDPERSVRPDEVVDHVLDEHYSLWEWKNRRARSVFTDRIREDATLGDVQTGGDAAGAYEQWEWTARMATFTNNDTRVYDWFDLEWWLPLWDPAYVRFWADLPLAERREKSLHAEFAARKFADVAGVDLETAHRTDRDWTPADQISRTLTVDPTAPFAESFDDWLGAQAVPRSRWEEWGNYPLGWYGIIPENAAGQFSAASSLYGLRALEAVGRIGFDPPWIDDPPLESVIDLPISEEPLSKS